MHRLQMLFNERPQRAYMDQTHSAFGARSADHNGTDRRCPVVCYGWQYPLVKLCPGQAEQRIAFPRAWHPDVFGSVRFRCRNHGDLGVGRLHATVSFLAP